MQPLLSTREMFLVLKERFSFGLMSEIVHTSGSRRKYSVFGGLKFIPVRAKAEIECLSSWIPVLLKAPLIFLIIILILDTDLNSRLDGGVDVGQHGGGGCQANPEKQE